MEFHGAKDKIDMWINYFPGECEGLDDRVVEFFRSVYERGMEKYREIMFKSYQSDEGNVPPAPGGERRDR